MLSAATAPPYDPVMAKEYRRTASVRGIGAVMTWLARRDRGPAHILTTTGRKTGARREVPVSPIEVDGVEYLVAPYGAVPWVLNLRARPEATLQRGQDVRTVAVTEVDGTQAATVAAAYHAREGFARRYMDVPDDPVPADFEAVPGRFPVFRVEDVGPG